jgi:hypothetical protein
LKRNPAQGIAKIETVIEIANFANHDIQFKRRCSNANSTRNGRRFGGGQTRKDDVLGDEIEVATQKGIEAGLDRQFNRPEGGDWKCARCLRGKQDLLKWIFRHVSESKIENRQKTAKKFFERSLGGRAADEAMDQGVNVNFWFMGHELGVQIEADWHKRDLRIGGESSGQCMCEGLCAEPYGGKGLNSIGWSLTCVVATVWAI